MPSISPAPSQLPSASPSQAPSVSFAPTLSPQPSVSPSISPSQIPSTQPSRPPSDMPTISSPPSLIPSAPPSRIPTLTPTNNPTPIPTISLVPSAPPSQPPTNQPSSPPSVAPTITPVPTSSPAPSDIPTMTPAPSVSPAPTFAPTTGSPSTFPTRQLRFYANVVEVRDGESGITSKCFNDNDVAKDQVVQYAYQLNLDVGTDVNFVKDLLETRLHRQLVTDFLDECDPNVNNNDVFDTKAISTFPANTDRADAIPCAQGTDCYVVLSSFTATILRVQQRVRELNDRIADEAILEVFMTYLQNVFQTGNLLKGVAGVQSSKFKNITNFGPTPAPTRDDGNGDFAGFTDNRSTSPEDNVNKLAIGLGIGGGFLLLMIIMAMLLYTNQKYEQQKKEIRPVPEYHTDSDNEGPAVPRIFSEVHSGEEDDLPFVAAQKQSFDETVKEQNQTVETIIEDLEETRRSEQIRIRDVETPYDSHYRSDVSDYQNLSNDSSFAVQVLDGNESIFSDSQYLPRYDYSNPSKDVTIPKFLPIEDVLGPNEQQRMRSAIQDELGPHQVIASRALRDYDSVSDTVEL